MVYPNENTNWFPFSNEYIIHPSKQYDFVINTAVDRSNWSKQINDKVREIMFFIFKLLGHSPVRLVQNLYKIRNIPKLAGIVYGYL